AVVHLPEIDDRRRVRMMEQRSDARFVSELGQRRRLVDEPGDEALDRDRLAKTFGPVEESDVHRRDLADRDRLGDAVAAEGARTLVRRFSWQESVRHVGYLRPQNA